MSQCESEEDPSLFLVYKFNVCSSIKKRACGFSDVTLIITVPSFLFNTQLTRIAFKYSVLCLELNGRCLDRTQPPAFLFVCFCM